MSEVEKLIYHYMERRLIQLGNNVKNGKNSGELAILRRGIGKMPGDIPELWNILFDGLPEELMSKVGEPSYAEWSIYTALTLYALHQQGNSSFVHEHDVRLGMAISKLVSSEDERKRISRRFNAFATSTDMIEAAYHLRGLIQLLKANNISLDYSELACELYKYQFSDEMRSRIRLRWGQDFYRNNKYIEIAEE